MAAAVGLGGGVSFPIGKPQHRDVVADRAVGADPPPQRRHRRSGKAARRPRPTSAAPDAQANAERGKLAHALFQGFPGESGRTITVK